MRAGVPKGEGSTLLIDILRISLHGGITALCLFVLGTTYARAESKITPHENQPANDVFQQQIRPLLKEYCVTCHSSEEQKGELDLEPFSTLEAVKKHPKVWQSVAEQLANNEMPPKKKPQPTPEEKERLSKWVMATLDELARAQAGDPGPVVLRRLSNAEYTYTVRDLTGVESLDPAREFPADGAAGEGFTNTGQALVMSPALITKYLDAAKGIAAHAVFLPDGIRFSAKTTRRDWTEEIVARIREFYAAHTDARAGEKLSLQGVAVDMSKERGRLPLEKYLRATLEERDALARGAKTPEDVARERGLSAKYLATLFAALSSQEPSVLLDPVRARWRTATPAAAAELVAEIAPWQDALWKFNNIGHLGKVGGPKGWMEPINPVVAKQELRLKIPTPPDGNDVTLFLVATDAGDGGEHDAVVWEKPRLIAPGRPPLLLRDLPELSRGLGERRVRTFGSAAKCLNAAAEVSSAEGAADIGELARRHSVDPEDLAAWLAYLGIGSDAPAKILTHFTTKIPSAAGYHFIRGWGSDATPSLVANSSGEQVRIPGLMKPHSVAVHPSPELQAAVAWRSPEAAVMRIDASVTHAHPECGNGVTWSLELRRGATRQRLAKGIAQGAKEVKIGPLAGIAVQQSDLVSLLIGPRDGNHSCDLTSVDLSLVSSGDRPRAWSFAADVSPDVLAGNPHADSFGNEDVWHFYTEPVDAGDGTTIPAGSLLAKWHSAIGEEKSKLAEDVQKLLLADSRPPKDSPDAQLREQLVSLGGPLFSRSLAALTRTGDENLTMAAPGVIEVLIPAEVAAGSEFITTGALDPASGREGSVQFQVLTTRPASQAGLLPSATTVTDAGGQWTDNKQRVAHSHPIIANEGSAARRRIEDGLESFRQLFPAALCYTKIVPVDEVVTLTLFHREDEHLTRLILDDAQRAQLDRLWEELRYVSHEALTRVDVLEQLIQFATQDASPKVFEPLRAPYAERAAAFRQQLVSTEPQQLAAVIELAERAYRRPLQESERGELRNLYQTLRRQEIRHGEAIHLTLARVLVAPAFLYRAENPAPGIEQAPIGEWELASRLSYFLWSSMPDAELRAVAAAGKLREPGTLLAQMRRMLSDSRARRLALEFGCQWLHIRDFDTLDEKSKRHFPTFAALRGAMHEESIRFFTDLFQHDRSVLSILDADHTYVNEALAKHYGISGVTGEEWKRVENVKQFARGGVLAQAATLTMQSGASRTSPILRGNWVAEVLLGDKLPRPPKDVPQLPADEGSETLTVRQLTEKHSSDARCYGCHVRIDAFGFALERFDAIGRHRERDLGDRPIDTRAKVMDGTEFDGLEGLREYLLTNRRDAFLRQFCRKLLGYALGRGVQLSDEPLLAEMQATLKGSDYRISAAVETILRSRPFLEIRGRDAAGAD